jgi:hypothetical protein
MGKKELELIRSEAWIAYVKRLITRQPNEEDLISYYLTFKEQAQHCGDYNDQWLDRLKGMVTIMHFQRQKP